mmetsp:Transcript_67319/g.217359  ORF Transcript_67319/g.217359 Transcript_67319/m.217359 type:complete len:281 (+) Transcript_67319:1696-2538(+)
MERSVSALSALALRCFIATSSLHWCSIQLSRTASPVGCAAWLQGSSDAVPEGGSATCAAACTRLAPAPPSGPPAAGMLVPAGPPADGLERAPELEALEKEAALTPSPGEAWAESPAHASPLPPRRSGGMLGVARRRGAAEAMRLAGAVLLTIVSHRWSFARRGATSARQGSWTCSRRKQCMKYSRPVPSTQGFNSSANGDDRYAHARASDEPLPESLQWKTCSSVAATCPWAGPVGDEADLPVATGPRAVACGRGHAISTKRRKDLFLPSPWRKAIWKQV